MRTLGPLSLLAAFVVTVLLGTLARNWPGSRWAATSPEIPVPTIAIFIV